ncbi:MerC domain-containing protein [Sphingomonas sp. M1-B02]|uniref:MerC domain-containing protein n=1 Tax=Sphingomonas sp. M1-B02 TaxID=3114300 RepID=UPI00223F56D6|nr:MerC domain-containing protein [Sphingomonas sp. S6-11]UZK67505.1 MerC domain-containing protein [Sphingomonas sp. S6-11]
MPASLSLTRFWGGVDARFDRIAIGLSGLCLVHCLTTTILLTVISSAGALLDPAIHEVGLSLAIVFGIIALGKGLLSHGYMAPVLVGAFGIGIMGGALTLPHGDFEIFWTLVGVSLVALGHDLNRRATR